jgi:hypothetical protein
MRKLDIKNAKKRDEILAPFTTESMTNGLGGVYHFTGVTAAVAAELLRLRFLDPKERQNDAPEAKDMIRFINEHPGFTLHGYAVVPERDDYRVTFEGVEFKGKYSESYLKDFVHMFRDANDLIIEGGLFCWYD